jgi:hypothetical protein
VSNQQQNNNVKAPTEDTLPRRIAQCFQTIKYNIQARRAKKKNETAPDRAARRTANATWFIAFFTAVTICVGLKQWQALHNTDERIGQQVEAMGRQLTLMESDQRPWIKVSNVTPASSLNFKSSGASTSVSIEAVNVGKSVAFNVTHLPICTYSQEENNLMPYRPPLVEPAIRIQCHSKPSPQQANLFFRMNQSPPTDLMR